MRFSHLRLAVLLILGLLVSACSTEPQRETENPSEPLTVFLFRHAEKADDGTDDPPLTDRGLQRARVLRDLLLPNGIDHIYSTDYRRTRQTAQPLADTLNMPILSYPSFDSTFLDQLPIKHAGQKVLLIGHSNTVPATVNYLSGQAFPDLDKLEYDKLFLLSGQKSSWVVNRLSVPPL